MHKLQPDYLAQSPKISGRFPGRTPFQVDFCAIPLAEMPFFCGCFVGVGEYT
jgi:hypothetical protein